MRVEKEDLHKPAKYDHEAGSKYFEENHEKIKEHYKKNRVNEYY